MNNKAVLSTAQIAEQAIKIADKFYQDNPQVKYDRGAAKIRIDQGLREDDEVFIEAGEGLYAVIRNGKVWMSGPATDNVNLLVENQDWTKVNILALLAIRTGLNFFVWTDWD